METVISEYRKPGNVSGILTVKEASEMLHVTQDYVRNECRTGRMEAIKYGRKWLIPVHAVEAIINGGLEG